MALARNQQGLTLIELTVVAAVIALLLALAVPRLYSVLGAAKFAPGYSDMAVIPAALERFHTDSYTYPTGDDAAQVVAALQGSYLKPTTTFRNGFDQGYLYLMSQDYQHFWLIDLNGEEQDDDSVTPGQQVRVTCDDGWWPVERVFHVQNGPTATLTLPEAALGDPWQVDDYMWPFCDPDDLNPNFVIVTDESG